MVASNLCLLFYEVCRTDVPLAGGKGANLGDMAQAGLPIPPGFVVTSAAYRKMFTASGLDRVIGEVLSRVDRGNNQALIDVEKEIRPLFTDVAMDPDLRIEILDQYHAMGANVPVAVRSSATAEDLAGASFAGQQDTFLNIYGDEALIEAVQRCWSSLFTCQAIYYRHRNGFEDTAVSMAVVVQKMVNSEKSGVIFTVDPVSRNPYKAIVEGVYGLGEGIVSGAITPDHYKVDRDTYEISFKSLASKTIMFTKDAATGVTRIPVPDALKDLPVLSEAELRQLVDMANRVEAHFGAPQDIEWGAEGGVFYLLQSRPITTLQ